MSTNFENTIGAPKGEFTSIKIGTYDVFSVDVENWNNTYTDVGHNMANWNSTYTTLSSASGDWQNIKMIVDTSKGDWDATATHVSHNMNSWSRTYTAVATTSADWNDVYSHVQTTSSSWNHGAAGYATPSDIETAISDLVDSAPATLNTLNELASALGDDANFSTTITNQIGTKWTQDDTKISNWDSTYSSVSTNSADWSDVYSHVQTTSSSWGGAAGYTTDIGNNSDTTIEVTHNLNTNYITYSLIDNNTNEFVNTQTSIVDANKIQFVFTTAPTTNEYKVVIISTDGTATGGGGGSGGTSYTDSDVASYLNGNLDTHIIPDTNAAYDLGNAEYKIRHLFLSDNSIYMGDDNTPIRLNSDKKLVVDDIEVGGPPLVSTVENLPIANADGTTALVTDGLLDNPVLSYFHKGKWFRSTDNSEISDQVVDVYIIAGQSNAHGAAQVSTLSTEQSTQNGIFYSSWHENTSNASSTQYYSDWATSLVAGSTRGDNNTSSLEGSDFFGPELGFVNKANLIDLANGRPIGVLKHAIGASKLVDETSIVEHNSINYICIQSNQNTNPSSTKGDYIATLPEPGTTEGDSYWQVTTEPSEGTWSSNGAYYDKGSSDWDLTDTGDRRGDALRALKLSVADAINKLTQANYGHRIAGLIWWQGESGSSVDGLNAFIAHIRTWLDDNNYLDVPKSQFPVVITKIGYGTDLTPVADADGYVGIVDASAYGHSGTQNHVGTDVDGSHDTNNNGINDMFEIGQAYADQMQLAKSGSTNSSWEPSAIEADVTLWLDMDDQTTLTQPADDVISIQDKSTNGYTFTPESGATLRAVDLAQNGKNILRFDGNNDSTNQTSVAFDTTKSLKWYFVLKVVESSAHDTIFECLGGRAVILFNLTGAGFFKGDWYTNSQTHIWGSQNSNLLNEWVMLAVEWDIPNTTQRAWLNGTQYGGNVANAGLANFGTTQNVRFGRHQPTQFADAFDLGEVIFTEDISQANSQKIEGYLAHKWGITDALPANHSYKTTAP